MPTATLGPRSSAPPAGGDAVSWADALEAWATLGGAIVALAAAVATIWLLVHQIRETNRARYDAQQERAEATADRQLARRDREFAAAERRDAERSQARTVILHHHQLDIRHTRKGFGIGHVNAEATNFGSVPVTDVTLRLYGDERFIGSYAQQILHRQTVLRADESIVIDQEVDLPLSDDEDAEDALDINVGVAIYFTDIAGHQWASAYGQQPVRLLDEGGPKTTVEAFAELLEAREAARSTGD